MVFRFDVLRDLSEEMPEADYESFSNPSAPIGYHDDDDHAGGGTHPNLSNADFRKLLMTPGTKRSVPVGGAASSALAALDRKKTVEKKKVAAASEDVEDKASRWERRKKRKQYFAKLLKQQQEREEELSKRYRDRAKERREGKTELTDESELLQTSADYRAVAPDAATFKTAADRRKQAIENSKYLGGDMEHTHLVKGLDFALLQKVRAEISNKESEEAQLETLMTSQQIEKDDYVPEFHTAMGRNIYNILTRKLPERNENFFSGRMFYRIDIEDDPTDALATDIPTAILRSKADCPVTQSQLKDATNDMVINHLAQILSYLRHGDKHRKMKKKGGVAGISATDRTHDKEYQRDGALKREGGHDNIFDDVGDYVPSDVKDRSYNSKHRHGGDHRSSRSDHDRDRRGGGDYHRSRDEDQHRSSGTRYGGAVGANNGSTYFDKPVERFADDGWGDSVEKRREQFRKRAMEGASGTGEDSISAAKRVANELDKRPVAKSAPDGYFECYPDAAGFAGGLDDSDEDIDWTKMDMGNKKGPVGRWDFETQEEYSTYMSNKEALPKAAFQFGVKMNDGRKTRKQHVGPKDEKKALDREWEQISKIIDRRKNDSL